MIFGEGKFYPGKIMANLITFKEAIRQALREEMRKDGKVFLFGEDIGKLGGCFRVTEGLLEEFGEKKVIDTPLSESAIVGACIGAALVGMRPVGEIMFADEISIAMDQIVNNAAKARYVYGGNNCVPLVIRTPHGAGTGAGPHHTQSLEAWFVHVPGLVVVMPSTPADAKGLLKSSIRCDDPVIFFEHKVLYFLKGQVPEEEYLVPLGKADIKKEGKDVTVVATGGMVHRVLKVAKNLDREGLSLEVIDPRTLLPLDKPTILRSVRKTGRLVVVEEACRTGSFGGEVAGMVAEEEFSSLKAPIKRVTAPDTPVPASRILENLFIPSEEKIIDAIHTIST